MEANQKSRSPLSWVLSALKKFVKTIRNTAHWLSAVRKRFVRAISRVTRRVLELKRFSKEIRLSVRWYLGVLSLAVFTIVGVYASSQYVKTSRFFRKSGPVITKIPDRTFNDMTNSGMQTRVNMSNSWFQAGLLVAVAIVGFLFAKRGEANLIVTRGAPEIVMGLCAIFLLLSSFICHVLYLNEISYVFLLGGQVTDDSLPDILDWNLNYLFTYQFVSLILGASIALLTFVSAHLLKGAK